MSHTRDAGKHYVAVLLAAGQASRFGAEKLLHPLADGVAIAVHAVHNLRAAGLPVTAVVRPSDFPLSTLLEQEGCSVTACRDASLGMGHTLAHGVRETPDAAGWIVALADMPRIRAATIVSLIDALRRGAMLAAPAFHGRRGHPVGFDAGCYAELTALTGDEGARSVLQAHVDRLVLVECNDAGVLYDIDRKQDLHRSV